MYRKVIEDLFRWKDRPGRKPLILRGARQTGKTWVLEEFGREAYEQTLYVNFEANPRMAQLFEPDLDPRRIIAGLELYGERKIGDPAKTLLIFDEIGELPRALASLKNFHEKAPEYQLLCAASFWGEALPPGASLPGETAELLDLRPLSFREFLLALGKEHFVKVLEKGDFETAGLFREELTELLKSYFMAGGMPGAVDCFLQTRDWGEVRRVQDRILEAYDQDFSRRAPPALVPKIRQLWNSIPRQLARENRKFMYGLVREGARAKDYRRALSWLAGSGLVHLVHRLKEPRQPLPSMADPRAFKLYPLDLGLLSALGGLSPKVLLDGRALFGEFQGGLAEQYALQELKALNDRGLWYWSNPQGLAELDFIFGGSGGEPVPLEVEAEPRLQATSLKAYGEKYRPPLALRTSLGDYGTQRTPGGLLADIPLYGIGMLGIEYLRGIGAPHPEK
jgi:predicted AAA+ superfamily ATPase